MTMLPIQRCAVVQAFLMVLSGIAPGAAAAATIGNPIIDIRLWGITDLPAAEWGPGRITGPGLHGPLLGFATELDLVNGGVVRQATVGLSSGGSPVTVEAGVANDGDTFWVLADTPNHYQRLDRDFIGSEAQVKIYQSYTKDAEDATLSYTFSRVALGAFISAEFGPQCQQNEPYCLRTGLVSLVELYSDTGVFFNADLNTADVWSQGNQGGPGSGIWDSALLDGNTPWPWKIEETGFAGNLQYLARIGGTVELPIVGTVPLPGVTNTIDLSAIALGDEFTAVYTLYAYALDTSADVAPFRTAEVFARDPLDGDTGVRFEIAGLTPTNNPSIRPSVVPAPAAFWLLSTAVLGLARFARTRPR
jgi:hypothetical protein